MDSSDAINKYKKLINGNDTYTLKGKMDIVSNEELYHYDIVVDYMKSDYYRASLTNTDNNQEQIILKNSTGVYVITPSLNKSFKFQSAWPYNSSQSYILASLLKDLENDSNVLLEEKGDKIILSSTVNYPNNTDLISQRITFNKDMVPELVQVFNKDVIENITFKIVDIEFNTKLNEDYFSIDNHSENNNSNVSSVIDEIVYPMYLPSGTKFKSEETIKTDESERVILTFTGDKPFILIEEASKNPDEFEVTTVSGELVFYENVLGNLTDNSLNWSQNGKDYYLISDNLTNEELLKVASSTSVVSLTK